VSKPPASLFWSAVLCYSRPTPAKKTTAVKQVAIHKRVLITLPAVAFVQVPGPSSTSSAAGGPYKKESLTVRGLCGFVPRRILLQDADETAPGIGNYNPLAQDDVSGCELMSVDLFVRVIVGTE